MFIIALTNVLVTLFYIIPGFILSKIGVAKKEHLPTLGTILIYVGTPFMEISSFLALEERNDNMLINMALCFILSMSAMILFVLLLTFIFRKKSKVDIAYRVATTASVCGNLGYFGLPIIRSLFPNNPEVAAYSQIFMLGMNIIVFSLGVYCLTGEKKYISLKKAFINPSVIGFVFAFMFYISNAKSFLPVQLIKAFDTLGNITTPLCMIILGIRLAHIPFKKLINNPKAYLIVFLKLIAFPLFVFALLYFLPIDLTMKASMVVLGGVPCAAVVLSLAEIYNSEQEISANVILLSTILSFISIPLITLLIEVAL